ncbi:hypothetical protein LK490_17255, partial [Blautia sp. MSK22_86]|uniref:hypothetical protein n=1 Tax=Blautia sp. MSK22_86 TaxID=2884906 RepID=UPI001D104E5C
HRVSGVCTGAEMLEREDRRIEGKQEGSAQMDRAFFFPVFIARPENNAKNSAPQSVNYCVTDFRRTPVRLQICSLQFALCSTAFLALFSGLAIEKTMRNTLREFLKLSRQSLRSRASTDFGSLPA